MLDSLQILNETMVSSDHTIPELNHRDLFDWVMPFLIGAVFTALTGAVAWSMREIVELKVRLTALEVQILINKTIGERYTALERKGLFHFLDQLMQHQSVAASGLTAHQNTSPDDRHEAP